MKRTVIGAALAALLLGTAACSTAQPDSSTSVAHTSTSDVTYSIQPASTVQPASTAVTFAPVKGSIRVATDVPPVRCDLPVDDHTGPDIGYLAQECDFRVTGEPC